MKWGHVILVYFMAGSLLWAGGLIGWGEAGVGATIINNPENGTLTNQAKQNQDTAQNAIQQAAAAAGGGPLLAIVNFIGSLISVMFWPFIVLGTVGAPPTVQVVLGGGLATAFIAGFIRFGRGI